MIKGHSVFEVSIKKINNKYVISKKSDIKNSKRLEKQINKQIYFFNNNFLDNYFTPKVLKKIDNNDGIEYIMEYIYFSKNIIKFFELENNIKINWLTKQIINCIDSYINKCKYSFITESTLRSKIESVKINIDNNKFLDINNDQISKYLNYLTNNSNIITKISIPIGICHGDLTLSNILIDVNHMSLYLIDFLDSFIESPLLDIVKVRQDTKYYWTLFMCDFNFDKNRIKLCLNNIDITINKYFQKYDFYTKGYKYFQILNLLRVIQYASEERICNKILKDLKTFII